MQEVFAIICLNVFGFIFGAVLGKSVVKDEGKLSDAAVFIVLLAVVGTMAGVNWLGLSMGWV